MYSRPLFNYSRILVVAVMWNLSVKECDTELQIMTIYHGYMDGNFPPRFKDIEPGYLRLEDVVVGFILHKAMG